MSLARSTKAAHTSWYRGSPSAPGSLVRSSTVIFFTLFGRAAKKEAVSKGRYSRTLIRPTFSFLARSRLTTSSMASQPLPMATMTRSALGSPT